MESNTSDELYRIKERLLVFNRSDIREGLSIACEIKGLGTAGASGLLALMYPESFGTVDQFAVNALCGVTGLPESVALAKIRPKGKTKSKQLTINNGVMLIEIMRRKAAVNNRLFGTSVWTPRKIDQVLWGYRE